MNIEKFVHKLIKKHGTNDPFIIAKKENIHIIYIKLGGIFGNYIKYEQIKFILIDKDKTPPHLLEYVCAHELGHALLTPDVNTLNLKEYTTINRYKR